MFSFLFVLFCACRSEKPQNDSATLEPDWWETENEAADEDSQSDDIEKEDTAEKPEEWEEEKDSGVEDVEDCAENFDPDVPCQGDWTTTLCLHEGQLWWCDNGVWLNEEDK